MLHSPRISRLAFLITFTLTLILATGLLSAQQRSPLSTAAIEERSHVISVAGRLRPRSRIEHSVSSAGFVEEIFVEEGAQVRAGETLLTVRRRDDALELYQPSPVTSRVSGRIAEISVRDAQEVQAGQQAVVILGTDGFIVETLVSDKDAFRVSLGQRVTARTTTGDSIPATVSSRSQEPDYETGLYDLSFEVPPTESVRLGEFLVIELPVDRVRGIFVPREAVVRRFGSDAVWTVTADDELAAQLVELGATFGELVHVTEGLDEGTRYVAVPTGRERDGQPVAGEER